MGDEEKTTTNEKKEQIEPVAESPENFEDVVGIQEAEVAGDIESVEETGEGDISSIEKNDGLLEEVGEMKEVAEKTTEEAKEANEEYYEELRGSIPNFDDKVEAIKKEGEAREETQEEYNEKLKDIPNAGDLAESFKTEEIVEEPVAEVEELSAEPEVETRKDGKLFDRLSELNVSIEAINMEDTEAAIEKIDSALLDLDSFIIDNQEAINDNQELETIVNTSREILEYAKSKIEKRSDDTQKNKEDIEQPSLDVATAEFMKKKLGELEKKGLGDETEANYIKWKLNQESKERGNNSNENKESEKPSVGWEVEDESPVEYYQGIYDDTRDKIKTIVNSNKNSYEKIDDLDREIEALKGSNDNFIPDDILEDEGVKEMIQDLNNKFADARSEIKESKTEEEKKVDAEKAVDFAVDNANISLDFLKTSKETPSGKMSSLEGAMSLLESLTKKYKDIINSNKELQTKLDSARKSINSALEKQKKLQAENDKLATKYNV